MHTYYRTVLNTYMGPLIIVQVRLTYWGEDRTLVSWATGAPSLVAEGGAVQLPNLTLTGTWVKWGWRAGAHVRLEAGVSHAYTYPNTTSISYVSGVQHHAIITGARMMSTQQRLRAACV